MTSFVESLSSRHGEAWLVFLRSVISRSTNSLNNNLVKDAKIYFLREYLLLSNDKEILEIVKRCDKQFLYDNFDAVLKLYFQSLLKRTFLRELHKVQTVWRKALEFAEKNDKKVDLKNMTLKRFLNQGVNNDKVVKLTTSTTLGVAAKPRLQALMQVTHGDGESHCCENYITRGGYHVLVHKQEKHFADNPYQRLRATEIGTYFGEEQSAYLVQVYFKQCKNENVQMYNSSYLYEKCFDLSLPFIDLQHRSYLSKEIRVKMKFLIPCLICFTMGVEEACNAGELGHTLKQSKKAIFYGFSYALECGRSRMFGNGVRKKKLRETDGKYSWEDTDTSCERKMWFCCKDCMDRRTVLKEKESGKRLSKRRKVEKNTLKPHAAFSEFKHLSTSHGMRGKVADVMRTLCNVRASKTQKFPLSDGEIVTRVTLREDGEGLRVCVNVNTETNIDA